MRTDELIALLAKDPPPVDADALRRRHAFALGAGVALATLLMMITLDIRADLASAAGLPMFWVKLALPAALLVIAVVGAERLSRPGIALGHVAAAVAVPVAAIWMLSAVALMAVAPADRTTLLLGESWKSCPFSIAMLSVPTFVAVFWAMRGMAPTRPALAGAWSGLLAGAAGALVYCLHCPEMAPPFLGTWYLLGIALPALAGALAGPRLLRW